MARRRRGRPKLVRDKIRNRQVGCLVTAEEHARIRKAAQSADMSISAWIRERILPRLPK